MTVPRLRARLNSADPLVMGVLNVTPDSFSDGGLYQSVEQAVDRVGVMIDEGVDIIDIGGESTRPGSIPPTPNEELDRVLPILEAVRTHFDIPISIDTSTPEVMRAALRYKISMINDVRALQRSGAVEAIGDEALVVLMHMQGTPQTMQVNPRYTDVVKDVWTFLSNRIAAVETAGVAKNRLILDPGFGFGKTLAQNLQLIQELPKFLSLGCPVMVGLSRKSSIRQLATDLIAGSVAGALASVSLGAKIVRVHDVGATVSALSVWHELGESKLGAV